MIYAKSMTKHWFQAYIERYVNVKRFPHKTRYDAINAAWNYFYAFNDKPISEEAREWFEKNIGKVSFSKN